jgi:predicted nucleotidyltransferase
MIRKLLDLSGKIDERTVKVLESITNVAASLKIPFFVVGATARDIVLGHGFGVEIIRATQDIDLAVQVSDWDQYGRLKEELIATGNFKPAKEAQRVRYEDGLPVDIVPFGIGNDPDHIISWPPGHEIEMSTLGFEEAFNYSQLVRLRSDPHLDVPFATPCGLTIMKIMAWKDRDSGKQKDAADLGFLMRNYIETGLRERFYDEHTDLLEAEDFDYEKASAQLLGRDIAKIATPQTTKALLDILEHETGKKDMYQLVEDLMKNRYASDFEENLQLLEAFKKGIEEG